MASSIASTSKLPSRSGPKSTREPSLLSNSRTLPAQDEYQPPAQKLAKYLHSTTRMQSKDFLKSKSIPDQRLAHHLSALSSVAKASSAKSYEHDDLLLSHSNAGLIETESELERTWRVTQGEIVESSAMGVASKSFSLKLDEFGPYCMDYTRNGR
jgi:hypothetical protein